MGDRAGKMICQRSSDIRSLIKMGLVACGLLWFGVGCAGLGRGRIPEARLINASDAESLEDVSSALTAITGSVSNRNLSEEELYQAARRMREDPQAQTAVEAISSAFDRKDIRVKYSPVTGKRYSAQLEVDPETGVKLLPLE